MQLLRGARNCSYCEFLASYGVTFQSVIKSLLNGVRKEKSVGMQTQAEQAEVIFLISVDALELTWLVTRTAKWLTYIYDVVNYNGRKGMLTYQWIISPPRYWLAMIYIHSC